MRLLNQGAGNDGTVLQHIFQIYQVAVVHMLRIVVRVVEVDDTGLVGGHDLLGQEDAAGDVLGDFACHVVTLDSVDGGVLVGVLLLDLFVVALDQAQDPVIGGVGLTQQAAGVAVGDILLGHLESAVSHDGLLHQVLNFLNRGAASHFLAGNGHALGNAGNLQRGHANLLLYGFIGLGDGHEDFIDIENYFCTVSFNNFHRLSFLTVGPPDRRARPIILYIVVFARVNHKIL